MFIMILSIVFIIIGICIILKGISKNSKKETPINCEIVDSYNNYDNKNNEIKVNISPNLASTGVGTGISSGISSGKKLSYDKTSYHKVDDDDCCCNSYFLIGEPIEENIENQIVSNEIVSNGIEDNIMQEEIHDIISETINDSFISNETNTYDNCESSNNNDYSSNSNDYSSNDYSSSSNDYSSSDCGSCGGSDW